MGARVTTRAGTQAARYADAYPLLRHMPTFGPRHVAAALRIDRRTASRWLSRWQVLGWVRYDGAAWVSCAGADPLAAPEHAARASEVYRGCPAAVVALMADGEVRTVRCIRHELDYRWRRKTIGRALRRLRDEGLMLDVDYQDVPGRGGSVSLWQHTAHIPELRS